MVITFFKTSVTREKHHISELFGVVFFYVHQDGKNCRSAKSIRRELSPNSEDESPSTVKFIKMSCKYFTDGMVSSWGYIFVDSQNVSMLNL